MSQSNDKRCFTIMIVPHSEESTYSLRLPLYTVQIVVALLVLAVTGLCVLGYAYLKASAEAAEAQALREVNKAQQEEIDILAIETERMMEQIHVIDELVEAVTESLDIGEGTVSSEMVNPQSSNGYLQNPASMYLHPGNVVENSDSVRLYSSRSNVGGVIDRAADNITLLKSVVPERAVTLDIVGEYVAKAEAKPSIWPARGRLTSGFGVRRVPYSRNNYQFHMGVDIVGAHGSSIRASASGEVIFVGYRGSYGNLIIIDHGYDYDTHYAHLSDFAVNVGEQVEKGQVIGYMGATGRTTGTHLHYEVHHKGTPVNPYNYMKEK